VINLPVIKKVRQSQNGFTIIEFLIAFAIAGLLAAGITTSISQVYEANENHTARMIAVKEIEAALSRVNIDVQMAQEINIIQSDDDEDPCFYMELRWTEWDNTDNEVTYSLDTQSHQLKRQVSAGAWIMVATNINTIEAQKATANNGLNDTGNLAVTIEAVVEGRKTVTESRTFEINPRSTSQITITVS